MVHFPTINIPYDAIKIQGENMILISHRGNLEGKSKLENDPTYILKAISEGYDCEIDLHYSENKWFLGHDVPQYEISEGFLLLNNLWLHAKTIITLHELMKFDVNCFYHEKDSCVLTSKGYIWTYPSCSLGHKDIKNNSICVLPELYNYEEFNCIGICSDFIKKYK